MILIPDVNILVNAYRPEGHHHQLCRSWLQQHLDGLEPVGFLDLVCSGFVRIATNARIFKQPAAINDALAFVDAVTNADAAELLSPDSRWWPNFSKLCMNANAQGNLVTDAHIAAAAQTVNGIVISLDADFEKFPAITWRRPE